MTGTPGSPRPDRIAGPGPDAVPRGAGVPYRPRRLAAAPAPRPTSARTSPQRRAGLLLGAAVGLAAILLAWPQVTPRTAVVAQPRPAPTVEPTPSAPTTSDALLFPSPTPTLPPAPATTALPAPAPAPGPATTDGTTDGTTSTRAAAPTTTSSAPRPAMTTTAPAPPAMTTTAPPPAMTTTAPPPPPMTTTAPPPRPDPASAIRAVADAVAAIQHPGARNTLSRDWATASEGMTSLNAAGRLADFEALVAATRRVTDAERVRIAQALATVRAAF